MKRILVTLMIAVAGLMVSQAAFATKCIEKAKGQKIYVPAYSHVYYNKMGKTFPITTTLVIHNVDPKESIEIISAKYYDAKGELVEEYYKKSVLLKPLEAVDILVKNPGKAVGSGSCFLVEWKAKKKVNAPMVECILIGATGQQGISFISPGTVVEQTP